MTFQEIHNVQRFGELGPGDPVIVIQVHDRWMYLTYLLDSLSRTDGIQKALIVFSHDYYDQHVIHLPSAVKFCKVSHTLN